MLNRRTRLAAAAAGALIASAVVPAVAATPRNATLTATGCTVFKPNRFIGDVMRFGRDLTVMKSGGTLTIKNRTREPHTFSIVRKSQVPRTARQAERCTVCRALGIAHGIPENGEGPPTIPVVDKGARGFSQAGEAVAFGPRQTLKVKITAKAGRTLSFLCAIHPWIQGKLAGRK